MAGELSQQPSISQGGDVRTKNQSKICNQKPKRIPSTPPSLIQYSVEVSPSCLWKTKKLTTSDLIFILRSTFHFVELLECVYHYGSISRLIGLDQSRTKREEKGQMQNIFVLPLYNIAPL